MNKEILILGFGRIGKNLIKRCIGFEMKVKVYDPFIDESVIKKFGGNKVNNQMRHLNLWYISIHMPLIPKQKFNNLKKLEIMKKNLL